MHIAQMHGAIGPGTAHARELVERQIAAGNQFPVAAIGLPFPQRARLHVRAHVCRQEELCVVEAQYGLEFPQQFEVGHGQSVRHAPHRAIAFPV